MQIFFSRMRTRYWIIDCIVFEGFSPVQNRVVHSLTNIKSPGCESREHELALPNNVFEPMSSAFTWGQRQYLQESLQILANSLPRFTPTWGTLETSSGWFVPPTVQQTDKSIGPVRAGKHLQKSLVWP